MIASSPFFCWHFRPPVNHAFSGSPTVGDNQGSSSWWTAVANDQRRAAVRLSRNPAVTADVEKLFGPLHILVTFSVPCVPGPVQACVTRSGSCGLRPELLFVRRDLRPPGFGSASMRFAVRRTLTMVLSGDRSRTSIDDWYAETTTVPRPVLRLCRRSWVWIASGLASAGRLYPLVLQALSPALCHYRHHRPF